MKKAISAVNNKDDEKLSESLKKIHSQDPTVTLKYSNETKELLLGCQGEITLGYNRLDTKKCLWRGSYI